MIKLIKEIGYRLTSFTCLVIAGVLSLFVPNIVWTKIYESIVELVND